MSLESIIEQIKAGNFEPVEMLYATYREAFIRWASRRFDGNVADFQDAWQEAVIAFYEQVVSGKLTSIQYTLQTWLFAVGYKRLLQYRRKTKRLIFGDSIDRALVKFEADFDIWKDDAAHEEQQHEAEKAMRLLSPQCKEILLLRFYEGRKVSDIKGILGLSSENTVSATLSRCLRRMKEIVQQRNEIYPNQKRTPIV